MKRYLSHYSTNEEYLADRKNLDLPNVSFIKEIESLAIHTKNYQIDIYDMAKTIVYDSPVKLSFGLPTGITIEVDEYKNGRGTIITNTDITSINGVSSRDQITSIQLPSKLESIGSETFYGCTSLESVIIPDSVTNIGSYAFCGCTSLQSIIIPDSVTSIGGGAFVDCTSLQSIIIPDSVTSMGGSVFAGCTSLESVIIPNSITSIGGTFHGCTSLESIIIPDSVTIIDSGAFADCTSLESVIIPNSVTNIDTGAFAGCTSLQSIIIPNSVTSITSTAFANCTSLETVTFEGDVENIRIDYSSFAGTPWYNNLETETINGITYNTLNHITSFRPSQCDGTLSIKEGIKYIIAPNDIFNGMYLNVENITTIVLPDSLLTIDNNQFINYTNVTSVTIGSGVQSIGNYAFKNCTSLTTVTFNGEESEITMDVYKVFAGTPYLTNKYPEIMKITYTADNKLAETTSDKTAGLHTDRFGGLNIVSHTFENGVGEIVFDGPVITTGTYAFYASQIKTITLPASLETIDQYVFAMSSLESITIPASVKNINYYAFYSTGNLETVIYEGNESNINIDSAAFAGSLAQYNKPENKIIYEAPEKLTQLPQASTMYGNGVYLSGTNVSWFKHIFKDGVGTIFYTGPVNYLYGDLFVGEGITSVTLPPQLSGINAYAFYGCTTLTTVNYLGGMDNVNISENAFYNSPYEETIQETTNGVTYYANKIIRFNDANCDGNLVIKEGVKTIPYDMYGSQYFAGRSVITSVTIPESVTTIQDYAFSGCSNLSTVTFVGNQEDINIGAHAFNGTPYAESNS